MCGSEDAHGREIQPERAGGSAMNAAAAMLAARAARAYVSIRDLNGDK